MKITTTVFLFLGVAFMGSGCTTSSRPTTLITPSATSTKQAKTPTRQGAEMNQTEIGVPLSAVSDEKSLVGIARDLSKDGFLSDKPAFPYKISVGQTFHLDEGCSYNPSYRNTYKLLSIAVKNGKWTLTFSKYGPTNIHIYPFPPDSQTYNESEKAFAKTKPTTTIFTINETDPIDFDKGTGGFYAVNGFFVPAFVSKDSVVIQLTNESC